MKNYTETAEGVIKHMQIGDIYLPVKLQVEKRGKLMTDKDARPYPLRKLGMLVYATPGGGEYTK